MKSRLGHHVKMNASKKIQFGVNRQKKILEDTLIHLTGYVEKWIGGLCGSK